MAFHFSLQILLRLKESQENQQRMLLAQANTKVQECKLQIEAIEQQLRRNDDHMQNSLKTGLKSAEVQFVSLCREHIQHRRSSLDRELEARKQWQKECLLAYQRLHRDREALDTLRLSQLHRFQLEEGRREQRKIDDFFLLRREHLRRR